ncbi:unnamed protein product [Hymenolepis diminuta]|uniref:Uncharacterized protein n=1 Tax=Hymenolepis diminuta TaxID=6216 RepID=A0A564YLY9_HYMDI|nr:unnamed protein product [Hymenolepis diminuta]
MFTTPVNWNQILQQLQQVNPPQPGGNTASGQQPQQPLYNPMQSLLSQPLNLNQGMTGGSNANSIGRPMPPTLPPPPSNSAWYASNPPQFLTQSPFPQIGNLNHGPTGMPNLNPYFNPHTPEIFRTLPTPPLAHKGCPTSQPPQRSTQPPDIIPPNTTEPLPFSWCPFNNFRYGTGIFPGVPPSIERDLEYADEKRLMSNVPWFPSPPAAHATPNHPPKLEFPRVRGPPPSAHSGYTNDG